jgi:hypothetical protein
MAYMIMIISQMFWKLALRSFGRIVLSTGGAVRFDKVSTCTLTLLMGRSLMIISQMFINPKPGLAFLVMNLKSKVAYTVNVAVVVVVPSHSLNLKQKQSIDLHVNKF